MYCIMISSTARDYTYKSLWVAKINVVGYLSYVQLPYGYCHRNRDFMELACNSMYLWMQLEAYIAISKRIQGPTISKISN